MIPEDVGASLIASRGHPIDCRKLIMITLNMQAFHNFFQHNFQNLLFSVVYARPHAIIIHYYKSTVAMRAGGRPAGTALLGQSKTNRPKEPSRQLTTPRRRRHSRANGPFTKENNFFLKISSFCFVNPKKVFTFVHSSKFKSYGM